MFEQTDPKTLKNWLIVAAAIYFIVPFDLIPDFFGIPGRIDDLLTIGLLAWFYRKHVRQYVAAGFGGEATGHSANSSAGQGSAARPNHVNAFDAYEVLEIPRSASSDAIQAAYRERMKEYHPDKVAHLGTDLQKLAHEKSQEIQRAYRQLRG